MDKLLKFQSTVEYKINDVSHTQHSNELLITLKEKETPKPIVERKSIPYHKAEICRNIHHCACQNIFNALLAIILKIFK